MKYVVAYFNALWNFLSILGVTYLVSNLFFDTTFVPHYLIFISLLASIAGPVSVVIDEK